MAKISKERNLVYVFILLAISSIIGILCMETYVDKLNNEYSIDIRDEGNINSSVIKIIPWHGVTNIQLSNNKKYWIDHSYNYKYDNNFIGDNLNIGDSIIKNSNSDSLWIISSNGEFVFLVGEWLNKSKK